MAETGTLATKAVPTIFREMARSRRSGILRVTSGRRIRAVFFEKGRAVYALSNIPEDQLDVLLVRRGRLTRDEARAAKAQIAKEQEFGRKLIEMRLLDQDSVVRAIEEQVEVILHSVLQWTEGEFVLDTSARAAPDISLDIPPGQLLLEAARNTPPTTALDLLGGPAAIFTQSEKGALDGAILSSAEGYLLSRISRPMTVAEVSDAAGIPHDQILSSLLALVAAGFADVNEITSEDGAHAAPEPEVEELRRELGERLELFKATDYYGVLGIDRSAGVADVKRAYYALAKRYHPDRYHHASVLDVRERLENIFALVTKAYDTLKDSRMRSEYDARIGPTSKAPPPPPAAATRVAHGPPVASTGRAQPPVSKPPTPPPAAAKPPAAQPSPPKPAAPATPATRQDSQPPGAPPPKAPSPAPRPAPPATAGSSAPASSKASAPPTVEAPRPAEPVAEAPPAPSQLATARPATPAQLAEQAYRHGLQHFEKKDLISAVNFWREATRLDPQKSIYHFQLGSALAKNPRWMREAEKHLLEAARMEPLSVEVFLALGDLYKSVNLPKRAETQYRSVLSLSPGNAAARRGLAEIGVKDIPPPKGQADPNAGSGLLSKIFKRK